MKLIITSDKKIEEDLDTIVMVPEDFNHLHSHPYIATSGFTEIQIDLDDDIDYKYIQHLTKIMFIRPIYRTLDLTGNAVILLSYIYPDKDKALRFLSVSDRTKFIELVRQLADEFKWRYVDEQ